MSGSSRIKPFDVTVEATRLPTEWETWKYDLESFFVAQRIETQYEKRAQLAYLGGPGLQDLLRHLPGVDNVPHVTMDPPYYDVAVKCLNDYFEPMRRRTYERHLFHQITQNSGERFTDFVMRLRKQIARCNYDPSVNDELIADRITQGCNSEELRVKLLQKDRSLEEMISLGTSMAESSQQSKDLNKEGYIRKDPHEVNAVRQSYSRRFSDNQRNGQSRFQKGTPPRFQRGSGNERFICYSCGKRGHIQGSKECPARGTKCASCGKIGHWAKRCYSRDRATSQAVKRGFSQLGSGSFTEEPRPKRIRAVMEESEKEREEYVFYAMGRNVFIFNVGGVDVPMTIDSGADANIISRDVWDQLKGAGVKVDNMRTGSDRNLTAYASPEPMRISGMFEAEISAGGHKDRAKFYVVDNGQQCLLGDQTAKNLKVLKVGFDVGAVQEQRNNPFPKFRNVVVEIPINPEIQPVQQPYRRPPIALEQKIEEKLHSLLQQDIIERVNGPSPWVSPMVPVTKDSGEIRLCIDMRQANKAVLRETHPLPLVDEMWSSINGAVRFSKIDIKDAYYQLEISEKSRAITTFITKHGLFR
ncbi:uncharacterized protein LOC134285503 [Aedes albopictus]|uniref:CCHC-type domain-containing protein n=1 Tax=Aedes albopictus TaxID=7160 RepID=A0ABM1Y749_AEDAL